jgi:serine/threonine protein kinase
MNEPQKTEIAPQKTAVAPQKTATAPQKTATAPQKTAMASPSSGQAWDKIVSGTTYAPGSTVKVGGNSYTVESLIGNGTEGNIYIVSDRKRKYALKMYRPGYHTNTKVMPALQKLKGKGYLADIIDYSDSFELMEYIPQGNAAHVNLKGNAQAILAIAAKTAMALDQMHKVGIIHKDIKPANILIKDNDSWDTCLCDFGIADILNERGTCTTTQARTPIYAAPEMYGVGNTANRDGTIVCELTHKADFYSLGMTIISLWIGEGAFKSKEDEMAIDKIKGRISPPADMPDPLAKITRGLLIKNPEKRWDLNEIMQTIDGKDIPVDEDEIIEDLGITFNASKHLVANTPLELCNLMIDDPDLATKYLYRGQIEKWLKPYPELQTEIQDIVEKRYPQDQQTGLIATLYLLDPTIPFTLQGISRTTGKPLEKSVYDFNDVGNFCNEALLDDSTIAMISMDAFKEWVRVRSQSIAEDLPYVKDDEALTSMLRIQMICPLSDLDLRNDPSSPEYAMDAQGIGRLLNKVYNILYGRYKGDIDSLMADWEKPVNAPHNREISIHTIINIRNDFFVPDKSRYMMDFMDIKGDRLKDLRSWIIYCTDYESDDFQGKAGPKDDFFCLQTAWMKVIKGFGVEPVYQLSGSGKQISTLDELFDLDKKTLRNEYREHGLKGWLAIHHQEDPHANLEPRFAYEKLLLDYVEDVRKIDDKDPAVERFDSACNEADRLLSSGRAQLHGLNIRSVIQQVLTYAFAIIPGILLLAMLIFSIIENPVLDTSGMNLEAYLWPIGLIIAAILFFIGDSDGCLLPIIEGLIASVLIFLIIRLLGAFILYIFAVLVLAILIYMSLGTLSFRSKYAKEARKFTKPGFEEKVLEPLYFAFSNEDSFDSSLNGAFDHYKIDLWKKELKKRRFGIIIFIGAIWILMAFSLLIPKSERFSRFYTPLLEKVDKNQPEQTLPPLLDFESLEPGSKSDQVRALQEYLRDNGFLSSAVDGDYGPGTRKAVAAFQKANGLEETGVADNNTIQMINKLAAESAIEAAKGSE